MSDDEDSLPPSYDGPTATHSTTTSLHPIQTNGSNASSRTRPVVKLVVTSVTRSYSEPWRRRTQRESGGTGFLIPWNENQTVRILTNAHVVRNASSVRARSSFGPHVVNCSVEWISLPLDLALVKISDGDYEDFCKGWGFSVNDDDGNEEKKELKLLSLSTVLPSLDSNVTCVGFPLGGKQISVTRGVISRIDVDTLNVLRIQIDAAINPGNSGGVSVFLNCLTVLLMGRRATYVAW
jgi:S1-C subfamily serine protease